MLLSSNFEPGLRTSRDAAAGLEAIATALDHGFNQAPAKSGKLLDFAAIALGWLVLMTVIFYPALQLAAIAICAAVLGIRPLFRLILGPSRQDAELFTDREGYLRAA